ncbi:MFS general substrate transporter [Rhizopus microsporus ATCC 52813]|uniref:MFS general substrate transporter n=1 Tax=Rhizopus microsporus ATCC 52813 TaxID=1340429 RepID=A0A2G4SNS1_RHIZD|nr:MFS general substrate transporter [Rhizopus microsporus ATCC 52813]PHZ10410.1 MFS general substrate transporter [Rhizopus microsporus ATCC 52813]
MNKKNTLTKSYTNSIVDDNSSSIRSYPISIENESYIPGSRTKSYQSLYYDSLEEVPEPPKITPLPKLQLFIISIILFSEPLTSTILFPFIYFMLKDFHLSDDEKEIGAYAGWITSIFFVAQFCTAISWGKVSDRYGRRPVLLIGMLGNAISVCMFGLSKNIWWAIGSRAFCGAMNGNSGVARSMVSEITDHTNRAAAFSLFGLCWGIGMIGPALGGFLNHPVDHFPSLFGSNAFLKEYPYSLPCFVSATGSLIGFMITYMCLKESNPMVLKKQQDGEQVSLLNSNDTLAAEASPKPGIGQISKASLHVIFAYALFAFYSLMFDEVLPLYFTAPSSAEGLGLSSAEFAKMLTTMGILQLVVQFKIYPGLTRRFDVLKLCRFFFSICVAVFFVFPELTVCKRWWMQHMSDPWASSTAFEVTYNFILAWRFFANCLAFTSLGIMVSTSAAPEIIGTVNGFCQSCVALTRAIAPTFGGTIWSYSLKDGHIYPFDYHFIYYIMTIMALINLFHSYLIPDSVSLGGRK